MKKLDALNQNFFKCFKRDWEFITDKQEAKLKERTRLLNDKFRFNDSVIAHLRLLNDNLFAQEKKLVTHAKHVMQIHEQWVEAHILSGFGYEFHLSVWNGWYYAQLHNDFEGLPFYNFKWMFYHLDDYEPEKNWNVLKSNPEHPLANEFHCSSFRQLYDHTPLAWEDIMRIEKIELSIVVSNEFATDIPKNQESALL